MSWRQRSTVPGCRHGLLVKWRPRSWSADELLKAPGLLGGGRKATVVPLYCEERVRVSSRVEDGQLVAGCRRAPLVSACDVTACRPVRMRALFGRAGLEWWTLPLDSLVVRASQEFSLFEPWRDPDPSRLHWFPSSFEAMNAIGRLAADDRSSALFAIVERPRLQVACLWHFRWNFL